MLKDLLIDELEDLYNAEEQLVNALPKMAEAANSPDLREAFVKHLKQTQGQVERLAAVFESLDVQRKPKHCTGMAGLIAEGEEVIRKGEQKEETEADLALIGAAQRVEHYEIAAYGTAETIAERIEEDTAVRLLTETLEEEETTDELLTSIADSLYEEMIEGDEFAEQESAQPPR